VTKVRCRFALIQRRTREFTPCMCARASMFYAPAKRAAVHVNAAGVEVLTSRIAPS
jgi:hypothetical protein